jgi:hypothetical protein
MIEAGFGCVKDVDLGTVCEKKGGGVKEPSG